jgi:Ca2+/Na+ antiporter
MKDFDSLVGIWNEQKIAPKLDYKEIITQYKTSRNKLSVKIFRELLFMLLAMVIIVYLSFRADFSLWTSYLGLAIVFACGVYFIAIQTLNLKRIANSNTLFDKPQDHIRFIKTFRAQRHRQHTRDYKIYSATLSLGTAFYFIELAYKLGTLYVVSVAVITVAWFVIYYLFFLKNYIKKEEQNFQEMIENLERLDRQFKDVE